MRIRLGKRYTKEKNRKCPRCSGKIDIKMPIYSASMAMCIAKCSQCGRSWGICHADAVKYVVINESKVAEFALRKWNRGEIGRWI